MRAFVLIVACAAVAHAFNGYTGPLSEPLYTLQKDIPINNTVYVNEVADPLIESISERIYFEWEGYDGWYNNPAHPEWGGAGE